jgi:hypothetical protein
MSQTIWTLFSALEQSLWYVPVIARQTMNPLFPRFVFREHAIAENALQIIIILTQYQALASSHV